MIIINILLIIGAIVLFAIAMIIFYTNDSESFLLQLGLFIIILLLTGLGMWMIAIVFRNIMIA